MIKRPTLADIAAVANVSLMTVSRALNNKPGVSVELRKNIMQLADQMDYQPNTIARSLATNRTATIGLVVPDNTNPFFAEIARGVEDAAFASQYGVFLVNTNEEAAREETALDSLQQKGIDGLILCSSRLPDKKLSERIQRFPAVVLLNREVKTARSNLTSINVDDRHGALLAVSHLATAGRRRIAFIGGPKNSFSGQRRLEGFREGLAASNLPYDVNLVECCRPTLEGGSQGAAVLFKRCPDIDAFMTFNDLAAVGVLGTCHEMGRQVPEEVSIIGFDDIPLARIVRPQLSTVHVNLAEIGGLAMQALLTNLAGGEKYPDYMIEPGLILRGSA